MADGPGTAALSAALGDWRRNIGALLFAVAVIVVAAVIGTRVAYYTAVLLLFATWMAWFVFACIEWIRHAEF